MQGRKTKTKQNWWEGGVSNGRKCHENVRGKDKGDSGGCSGVVRESLYNLWVLLNHQPALLSVFRHLWPRGWR